MAKDKLIYASSARKAILKADPKLAYCIDSIPGVDAVEVVRCKDCKYGEYDYTEYFDYYECRYIGGDWNKGDHFCSYGERREGE
jgi:hypothetical protein